MDIWMRSLKYLGCHLSQWLSCSKSTLVHDHDLDVGVFKILIYYIVNNKPVAKKTRQVYNLFFNCTKKTTGIQNKTRQVLLVQKNKRVTNKTIQV